MLKQTLKRILGPGGTAALRRTLSDLDELRHAPVIRAQWLAMQLSKPAAVAPRAKRHILFVTEKWCDNDPKCGETGATHNLFGSLETSGLATYSRFHFDEYSHTHGRPADAALLRLCLETRPDMIFLTWMPFGVYNPRLETLRIIRDMGIPIVALWWDSVNPATIGMADRVVPYVAFNLVSDSASAYRQWSRHPEKFLAIFPPQDVRVFYDAELPRDLDVSFVGSIGTETGNRGFGERRSALEALRRAGIEVYHGGGQRETPLSLEDYARTFMRTKIGLNFSRAGRHGEFVHMKFRVFETTLCGAMLMELDNEETSRWFEPMVDYVPFTTEADLVDKTRYYLARPDERLAIARSGHRKATEHYNSQKFWTAVFNRAFHENQSA